MKQLCCEGRSSDTFLYECFHIYSSTSPPKKSTLTYLVSSVHSRGFEQCLARLQEFIPADPPDRSLEFTKLLCVELSPVQLASNAKT